jgi:hypothetical protein
MAEKLSAESDKNEADFVKIERRATPHPWKIDGNMGETSSGPSR